MCWLLTLCAPPQLMQTKADSSKNSALLINQHKKDSDTMATMRERLRTMETEVLEARAWRSQFERRKNEGVDNAASAALQELQAREQDYKLRQEADDNRARRLADTMSEMASRLESVRINQAKQSDSIQARLGVVENNTRQQSDKLVNLVDRETDASIITASASENNNSNIVDLQNALKSMQTRLHEEEEARRKLAQDLVNMQSESRRHVNKETTLLHDQIVGEANNRREAAGGDDEKIAFLQQMIEAREKANLDAMGDRMNRIEQHIESEETNRGKREETAQKDARKFFHNLTTTAKTETAALRSRHEAMTTQTQESLRELSTEVVNIQETTRKAEKRIGELTASSLQGISTAMESGMKQFQSSTKEIREVLSAEISARRNNITAVHTRIDEVKLEEDGRINDLGEQVGEKLNAMRQQVEKLPEMIADCTNVCKDFTSYECEKVRMELTLSMDSLTVKMNTLTQHVDDVREESKRAREHLESSLERMNKHLGDVDKNCKDVEFKLSTEIMDREKAVYKLGNEVKESLSVESAEREKVDSGLAETLSSTRLHLENKMLTDDMTHYAKGKQDLHDSEISAGAKRKVLKEELLSLVRNMDERERENMLIQVGEATSVCKSYGDQVSNEKFAQTQRHMETVREQLAKSTDAVRAALETEKTVRVEESLRIDGVLLEHEKETSNQLEDLKKFVTSEVDNQEKERNKIVGKISEECMKVEERVIEKVINEASSIRSLIKATVGAEASERMADVHDAKMLAEQRLASERDILKDQAARNKEFCLTKSAEWDDKEKNDRMAMDTAIMNELDVRTAGIKSEAESRDVLRAMRDQVADSDAHNRHHELEQDIRKLRKYAIEVMKNLAELRVESEKGDEALGERVDKEVEDREDGDEALEEKLMEMCKVEKEEREASDTRMDEKFTEIAKHEILVREVNDRKMDEKFTEIAKHEILVREVNDRKMDEKFTEIAKHEILVREVNDRKMDEKFEGLVNKEIEDRVSGDGALDEKFEGLVNKEIEDRVSGDDALDEKFAEEGRIEKEERIKEVLRLDGRADALWEETEKMEEHVERVETSTAKAFATEGKKRLEEDVEDREETVCRIGAENALRYVVDMVVGKEEQQGLLEIVERGEGDLKYAKEKLEGRVNYAIGEAETNTRAAKDSMRLLAEAEHREIVQLISDESGAVRGDVHTMLGDIENAVKGAEGSVITLDEKTTGEIEGLKVKLEEDMKKAEEERGKKEEERKEEIKKEMEGLKGEVKEVKEARETLKEEANKAAKEMIEAEMKGVKEELEKKEERKEGIDWDKLRQKADAPKEVAPEATPAAAPAAAAPEESGKLID